MLNDREFLNALKAGFGRILFKAAMYDSEKYTGADLHTAKNDRDVVESHIMALLEEKR